jgi:hypothetical protein
VRLFYDMLQRFTIEDALGIKSFAERTPVRLSTDGGAAMGESEASNPSWVGALDVNNADS